MSLHKDIRTLANQLSQNFDDARPGYQDALYDIADAIEEILDRHPLTTGHEWKDQTVFWSEEPDAPADIRAICQHCGMDRILGDEGQMCDRTLHTQD